MAGVNPWHWKQNNVLYALFHSPNPPNQSQPLTGSFMHEEAIEAEVKDYNRDFQIWCIKLSKDELNYQNYWAFFLYIAALTSST